MRARWTRIEQLVSETLVISLTQIMQTIFAEGAFQRTPASALVALAGICAGGRP
jgi:hypothetical protein